jgi:outer membrane protein assembly factor BamB
MMNHHGGVVLVNGYLYGFSNAILTCIEFNTGKVMWRIAALVKVRSHTRMACCICSARNNWSDWPIANPNAYVEKGRFPISDRGWDSWAHPVIVGGKLYIRNQNELTCYDVKGK